MTKQQFENLYLYKCVHCPTEENAIELLQLASSFGLTLHGYLFGDGNISTSPNTYWEDYKEKTIYYIFPDDISHGYYDDEIKSVHHPWKVILFDRLKNDANFIDDEGWYLYWTINVSKSSISKSWKSS